MLNTTMLAITSIALAAAVGQVRAASSTSGQVHVVQSETNGLTTKYFVKGVELRIEPVRLVAGTTVNVRFFKYGQEAARRDFTIGDAEGSERDPISIGSLNNDVVHLYYKVNGTVSTFIAKYITRNAVDINNSSRLTVKFSIDGGNSYSFAAPRFGSLGRELFVEISKDTKVLLRQKWVIGSPLQTVRLLVPGTSNIARIWSTVFGGIDSLQIQQDPEVSFKPNYGYGLPASYSIDGQEYSPALPDKLVASDILYVRFLTARGYCYARIKVGESSDATKALIFIGSSDRVLYSTSYSNGVQTVTARYDQRNRVVISSNTGVTAKYYFNDVEVTSNPPNFSLGNTVEVRFFRNGIQIGRQDYVIGTATRSAANPFILSIPGGPYGDTLKTWSEVRSGVDTIRAEYSTEPAKWYLTFNVSDPVTARLTTAYQGSKQIPKIIKDGESLSVQFYYQGFPFGMAQRITAGSFGTLNMQTGKFGTMTITSTRNQNINRQDLVVTVNPYSKRTLFDIDLKELNRAFETTQSNPRRNAQNSILGETVENQKRYWELLYPGAVATITYDRMYVHRVPVLRYIKIKVDVSRCNPSLGPNYGYFEYFLDTGLVQITTASGLVPWYKYPANQIYSLTEASPVDDGGSTVAPRLFEIKFYNK